METEWSVHKQQAKKAFDMIRTDSLISGENLEKQLTSAIDLQQALPTPKLSVGPAYYSRKIDLQYLHTQLWCQCSKHATLA